MKLLFDCANHYIQSSDWKILAIVKFCLCSIGVLLGLIVHEKHKKTTAAIAGGIFLATYIPLMADFLNVSLDYLLSKEEN